VRASIGAGGTFSGVASARSTSVPAPREGDLFYATDTGVISQFSSGSWATISISAAPKTRIAYASGSNAFGNSYATIGGCSITFTATSTSVLVRGVAAFNRASSTGTGFLRITLGGVAQGWDKAASQANGFNGFLANEVLITGLTIGSSYTMELQMMSDSGTLTINVTASPGNGQAASISIIDAS